MMPFLKLPLDFERRQSVCLLSRKLHVDDPTGLGIALLLWLDWGTSRAEFRPLVRFIKNDNTPVDWVSEDTAFVLCHAARWDLETASRLMEAFIDSGFLRLEVRNEQRGLVLDGFWPLNEHLSPDFVPMQKRGGHAAQARRLAKEAELMAQQQVRLSEKQGNLLFDKTATTPEERQASIALFIRLHRVCGLSANLPAERFTESAMSDALKVIREFTYEQTLDVETYLLANRDTPDIVKVPETILREFGEYVQRASSSEQQS